MFSGPRQIVVVGLILAFLLETWRDKCLAIKKLGAMSVNTSKRLHITEDQVKEEQICRGL